MSLRNWKSFYVSDCHSLFITFLKQMGLSENDFEIRFYHNPARRPLQVEFEANFKTIDDLMNDHWEKNRA